MEFTSTENRALINQCARCSGKEHQHLIVKGEKAVSLNTDLDTTCLNAIGRDTVVIEGMSAYHQKDAILLYNST